MRIVAGVAAVVVLSVLTGCGGGGSDDGSGEPEAEKEAPGAALVSAFEECSEGLESELTEKFGADEASLEEIFRLEDAETAPVVLVNPPSGSLAQPAVYDAVVCLLDGTDAPATVEQKLGASTALSGPQSEAYEGITFEWSVGTGFDAPELTASFTVAGE